MKKYELPAFLARVVSRKVCKKWLQRKAMAHVRRDRKRGITKAKNKEYKVAIHMAVRESSGIDAYTGERLHWNLINKWNNSDARRGGPQYKRRFALLPSVDHVSGRTSQPCFKICGWRTNDAKSDLSHREFLELCKRVIGFANNYSRGVH